MKNVLFTTTAVAALALGGTAFAAGHSSGNFGISGSTDVGYNDDIEGGVFQETNIDIKASKDTGSGFTIGGHARLNLDWREGGAEDDSGVDEVEFKSIYVDTPVGKLEFADSYDGTGASDRWYADRDGMTEDMSNGDGHAGVMWSGDAGQFEYAIDLGNLSDNSDVAYNGDHYTIGLGGSFGAAKVGFGFENNSHEGAGTVYGVSADFSAGIANIGASYIASDVWDSSIGLAASAEVVPGLTVGAYYAVNSAAAGGTDQDNYGVTLDYAMGGFGLAIDYNTGDQGDELEIDASYDMGNGVVLYAGNSDAAGEGYYVGTEIAVADGIKATIAYAEADEIGGPEFKDGTSAFLTLTY